MDFNLIKYLKIDLSKLNKTNIFYSIVSVLLVCILFKNEIINYVKSHDFRIIKDEPIQKKDLFGDYIDDDNFTYILHDLQDKYNCDYVNINMFHNGTTTPTGFHFKKMSAVVEVAKKDLIPRGYALQNWSIEPFKQKFKKLHIEKVVYISDMTKDSDPYFAIQIPRYGIHSVVYVGIFDYRYKGKRGLSHFVGFMSFQYLKPTDLSNTTIISMSKEVERIKEFVILK